MGKTKRADILSVLGMVIEDVGNDIHAFEGQPFNGQTVGALFGKQAAAIEAVAMSVKHLIELEEKDEHGE